MYYMVHYNRHSGKLIKLHPFEGQERASKEKLEVEISLLGKDDGDEVVVLEANDEDDLRRSHSRYFIQLGEFRVPGK